MDIINLVNSLIGEAHGLGASDIHVDPAAAEVRVRLRIDGVLKNTHHLPKHLHPEIISRVKVLAGLRTDEHQAAQDGRFRHALPEGVVDVRVSIVPTYYGEGLVMRLLVGAVHRHTLATLGFSDADQKKIETAMRKLSGMILATGPTGSGKTTTLYTLLQALSTEQVSLVTIEDPVEYAIGAVKQIQIHPHAGLTFATGLRSILRQDPDIIMVGEIRDAQTAGIAVNTALTGHLLLSTLHTNDAATTLPRLLDMGVDPYLVASTVNIAIGQRLVRALCPNCKEKVVHAGEQGYAARGCAQCGDSGYRGRLCISEVMVADDDIRDAIVHRAPQSDLKSIAIKNGMTTMLQDGLEKARAGATSVEEVLRVTHE